MQKKNQKKKNLKLNWNMVHFICITSDLKRWLWRGKYIKISEFGSFILKISLLKVWHCCNVEMECGNYFPRCGPFIFGMWMKVNVSLVIFCLEKVADWENRDTYSGFEV